MMPPVALYVSSDFARTRSSSPSMRIVSIVRSWKWPARGWIAVPAWRSTDNAGTPWCPSSIAVVRPTRLPPTISTGTSSRGIARHYRWSGLNDDALQLSYEQQGRPRLPRAKRGAGREALDLGVTQPQPAEVAEHLGIVV